MSRNEIKRHLMVIETLQDEMRQLRSSHTDEIRRYKVVCFLLNLLVCVQFVLTRPKVANSGSASLFRAITLELSSRLLEIHNDAYTKLSQL